jgi:KaiC/GvpD/RAD55 family RecA-like ATPase
MAKKKGFEKLIGISDYVALAVVDASEYEETNTAMIKQFIDEKVPGVYVTLSKPYEKAKRVLEKAKVDTEKIIFIDAITKTVSGVERDENVLLIGNPENLSDLSIAIDQAVTALPKQKFIFFDSLSVLLIYNEPAIVARFIHLLAGKMHVWKVKGIIVSLKRKKDEELIKELIPFCDIKLDL